MIYADTNVMLALFCPDGLTAAAEAWYAKAAAPVCISAWTVVEFRSSIGLRVRKGVLPRASGMTAMRNFDAAVPVYFQMAAPAHEHFVRAGHWLANPDCALQGADALHLGIAFGNGCSEFVTFDQPLGASGRKLKLNVKVLKP